MKKENIMKLLIKISELKPETIKKITDTLEKYNFKPYPEGISGDVVRDWLLVKGMRYGYSMGPVEEKDIKPENIVEDFGEDDFIAMEMLLSVWKEKNDDILDFLQGNLELGISLTPKHIGQELLKVDLKITGIGTLARKTGVIVTNSLGQRTLK